jgi:hypothetical protein
VIKVSKYVNEKISLINTLVLVSGRKRMQARPKDYNKNNGGVNWERNALLQVGGGTE